MRFSRRGVWTIPDSLDAEGAAAFSQLEVLLPAPPSGRIPAFPLRVHRLLRRFAQVIHMLTGTAGQQCCCRACVTRRPRRTLGPGADEIVQEGTDARHALQGGRSVCPPGACRSWSSGVAARLSIPAGHCPACVTTVTS